MNGVKAFFAVFFKRCIEKDKWESRLEAFGAASIAFFVESACNGDLCMTQEYAARLRSTLTIADMELYSAALTGAGWEW